MNVSFSRNTPPAQHDSSGPNIAASQCNKSSSVAGAAVMPSGLAVANCCKSRIRHFTARAPSATSFRCCSCMWWWPNSLWWWCASFVYFFIIDIIVPVAIVATTCTGPSLVPGALRLQQLRPLAREHIAYRRNPDELFTGMVQHSMSCDCWRSRLFVLTLLHWC